MKQRSVLLDHSFVYALVVESATCHALAKEIYTGLMPGYVAGRDRLLALSTVLSRVPQEFRTTALAPVETLRVARQYHTAAQQTTAADSYDTALTLVAMEREGVHVVATTSHAYDHLDVTILSAAVDIGDELVPDGYVAYAADSTPAD